MSFGAITTPAACLPILLADPSSFRESSSTSAASSLSACSCLSSGDSSIASCSLIPGVRGIIFAIMSPKPYDLPKILVTSRVTPRAAIVPSVPI